MLLPTFQLSQIFSLRRKPPQEKKIPIQVGSPRQEWEVNIKISHEEMKWVGVD